MTKIIAELCQNHLGDIDLLKKMVNQCALTGAEFCKIQSIDSDELTFRERFETGNGNTIKRPYAPEKERLDKLNLSLENQKLFVDECKKNNIKPLTTIFTKNQVKNYKKIDWGHNTVKIASYDCSSIPLLKDLISVGVDNFIISTGATFNDEIKKTCEFLNENGVEYSLLHCVTIYPTKIEDGHINRMNYLKKFCNNVGFSDHSSYENDWLKLSLLSILNNANYIERHFTSVGKNETKDGKVSLNFTQLKELVDFTKMEKEELSKILNQRITKEEIVKMLGEENRDLSDIELLNRDYYRGRFASKDEQGNYLFNWLEEEK